MMRLTAVVFCLLFCSSWCVEVKFPPWFKFGASTAAYQIEGAWNVSDKAESIWDQFTHAEPTVVADLSNGDVACDSFRQWRRDVDMAAELGLHFYRISIAWTRLLPTGYSNRVSKDGARFYSDLIDALLEKGIEPLITLYHFDLPQNLQELGGWTNPLITDWFASYARVVFSLYADRVKTWITINEPNILCDFTYTSGLLAPGFVDTKFAPFLCSKHVMIAHAKAWRIYDEQFKPLYHGKVSLSNNLVWYSPYSIKEYALTKLTIDFTTGRYSHPIYSKEGGWPPSMVKLMRDISNQEGYSTSRLPDFTQEEIELVRGTYDFYGLNYYTCRLVRRARPGEKVDPVFLQGIPELRAIMEVDPGQQYAKSMFAAISAQQLCPKGLREQMAWLKEQYGNIEVLITECGYSTTGTELMDGNRISFIKDHLEQVLLSIQQDGVNVTGFSYWSLMDNFEWINGYETKFGLYEVNFSSPERTRSPRSSASVYSQVIRSRALRVTSPNSKYFFK